MLCVFYVYYVPMWFKILFVDISNVGDFSCPFIHRRNSITLAVCKQLTEYFKDTKNYPILLNIDIKLNPINMYIY